MKDADPLADEILENGILYRTFQGIIKQSLIDLRQRRGGLRFVLLNSVFFA